MERNLKSATKSYPPWVSRLNSPSQSLTLFWLCTRELSIATYLFTWITMRLNAFARAISASNLPHLPTWICWLPIMLQAWQVPSASVVLKASHLTVFAMIWYHTLAFISSSWQEDLQDKRGAIWLTKSWKLLLTVRITYSLFRAWMTKKRKSHYMDIYSEHHLSRTRGSNPQSKQPRWQTLS